MSDMGKVNRGWLSSLSSQHKTYKQPKVTTDSKQSRGSDSSHNVQLNFTSRGFTLHPETSKYHRNFTHLPEISLAGLSCSSTPQNLSVLVGL